MTMTLRQNFECTKKIIRFLNFRYVVLPQFRQIRCSDQIEQTILIEIDETIRENMKNQRNTHEAIARCF